MVLWENSKEAKVVRAEMANGPTKSLVSLDLSSQVFMEFLMVLTKLRVVRTRASKSLSRPLMVASVSLRTSSTDSRVALRTSMLKP